MMRNPERYRAAIDNFNAGRFHDACMALDGIWWQDQNDFHQGLILFAAGFYHARRRNMAAARKTLLLAIAYLTPYTRISTGWNVTGLIRQARLCLAAGAGELVAPRLYVRPDQVLAAA